MRAYLSWNFKCRSSPPGAHRDPLAYAQVLGLKVHLTISGPLTIHYSLYYLYESLKPESVFLHVLKRAGRDLRPTSEVLFDCSTMYQVGVFPLNSELYHLGAEITGRPLPPGVVLGS